MQTNKIQKKLNNAGKSSKIDQVKSTEQNKRHQCIGTERSWKEESSRQVWRIGGFWERCWGLSRGESLCPCSVTKSNKGVREKGAKSEGECQRDVAQLSPWHSNQYVQDYCYYRRFQHSVCKLSPIFIQIYAFYLYISLIYVNPTKLN